MVREFRRESEPLVVRRYNPTGGSGGPESSSPRVVIDFRGEVRGVAMVPPLGCNCNFSNIRSAALDLRTGNLGNAATEGPSRSRRVMGELSVTSGLTEETLPVKVVVSGARPRKGGVAISCVEELEKL